MYHQQTQADYRCVRFAHHFRSEGEFSLERRQMGEVAIALEQVSYVIPAPTPIYYESLISLFTQKRHIKNKQPANEIHQPRTSNHGNTYKVQNSTHLTRIENNDILMVCKHFVLN